MQHLTLAAAIQNSSLAHRKMYRTLHKVCIKKIGLDLYLLLYFNFLTRKPIQMALITYLWLKMKTSQPKIISFVNSFFEMVKKFYDASNVHFLVFFPWFFWSLFNVSLHLRLNLINLGKLQCSFDVGEAATLPAPDKGSRCHTY